MLRFETAGESHGECLVATLNRSWGGFFPSEWKQMDGTQQVEVIQAIIERVGYDGAAQWISIRFHPAAITAASAEARE